MKEDRHKIPHTLYDSIYTECLKQANPERHKVVSVCLGWGASGKVKINGYGIRTWWWLEKFNMLKIL
jgi:hypothetical protein